jgi:hypothetical protein
MKITEINSDELQINSKGIGMLIGGILFAAVGMGLAGWGYISQVSTNRWISVGIGAAFIIGGVVIFLSAASRRVVLRRAGTSEVTTTKLITKKTTSITFTTEQIASINFETHTEYDRTTDSDGDTHETQQRVSSIRLLLKDTTEIVLATSRGGNGLSINGMNLDGLGRAPLYDEAARIASFYNVPLQTNMRNLDPVAGLAQVIATVKQGMSTAPTQPSTAVQPSQSPTLAAAPQPVPMTAPLSVQPVGQESGPLSTVVAGGVTPVVPVIPGATSAVPQQAQADSPQQLPPQN